VSVRFANVTCFDVFETFSAINGNISIVYYSAFCVTFIVSNFCRPPMKESSCFVGNDGCQRPLPGNRARNCFVTTFLERRLQISKYGHYFTYLTQLHLYT